MRNQFCLLAGALLLWTLSAVGAEAPSAEQQKAPATKTAAAAPENTDTHVLPDADPRPADAPSHEPLPAGVGKPPHTEPLPATALQKTGSQETDSTRTQPRRVEKPTSDAATLYQEVLVAHASTYRVQGVEAKASLKYGVVSGFTIENRSDGSLAVEQKIEAAKLVEADTFAQPLFNDLLQKLVGTTWRMTFSPQRELTSFEGGKDLIRAAAGGDALGGQTFLLASLIDQDGWKELDQLTFFQPPKPLLAGKKWERSLSHSWGFLGNWTGYVAYRCAEKKGSLRRIAYAMRLSYLPPQGHAGGLPFQITNAAFKHEEAGGTIYFDTAAGQVRRAEEQFHVKGKLSLGLLGQSFPVELDESQSFRLRILDYNPWSQ